MSIHNFSVLRIVVDAVAIVFCWFAAYGIRFHFLIGAETNLEIVFAKLAPLLVFLTLYIFYSNNLYSVDRNYSPYQEMLKTIKGNIVVLLLFVFLLYFFEESRISRLTIGIYAVLSCIVLSLEKLLFFKVDRHGSAISKVLLVGNGAPLQKYMDIVYGHRYCKARIAGHVDPGELRREDIRTFDNYESAHREIVPDVVLLSYGRGQDGKNADFLSKHYNDVTPIKYLPNLFQSLIGYKIEEFEGIPMLDFNAPSFNALDIVLKRLMDIVGSLLGLVFLSPLLVFIGILVKCSSKGPVFFGQMRVGLGGESFTMWKFRTMTMGEDGEEEMEWSSEHNPRKTAVGSFLRKTSLDELPQLWNVLRGDMGLIGPRPERPHFVEQFKKDIPGYMLRHKVRPGISGWAQINGWRGDTDLSRRIECDIFYIKNWSLLFDLKIIVFTFFKGFVNKNAY